MIAIKPDLATDRCTDGMGELVSSNPGWNVANFKFLDMDSMVALIEIAKERNFEFWHIKFLHMFCCVAPNGVTYDKNNTIW